MKQRFFVLAILTTALYSCAIAQPAKRPDWIRQEQFLRACEDGDVDTVKKYLADGGSVNVRDRFNQPPMLRLARVGNFANEEQKEAIAEMLLKAGADINSKNDFGSTAIFLTFELTGPSAFHKFLLAHGADATIKDKFGLGITNRPNFYDHAKIDQSDIAWRLLIEGDLADPPDDMSVVRPYTNGATFRMAAVYYDESDSFPITFLWPPEFDANGESYLFYAPTNRKLIGFEFKVIDPSLLNAPNKSGETALIRAAQFDNVELALRLLGAGAVPDLKDKEGKTALMHAVARDYFFTTFTLLDRVDPNVNDGDGRTPLMNACFGDLSHALIAFFTAKASIPKLEKEARQKPKLRKKDLAMAAAYKRIDVNARDKNGRTALMLAVTTGNAEAVKILLSPSMKADRALKDSDGLTALDYAKKNGNTAMAKLLTPRR